jgi:hypothetical protein
VVRPKAPNGPDERLAVVLPPLKESETFPKKWHAGASYSAPLSVEQNFEN